MWPAVAFEHVSFDLDGTLIDSRADLASATNHVRGLFGLPPLAPGTLLRYVGEGARVLVARALGPAAEDRLDDGLAAFMAYYGNHLLDATRPYAGMVAVLDSLAARGVVLSVLTNKPEALSRAILDGLGLTSRFVEVVGGDSLTVRKPDPAGLERLRARSATSRERMLLVGDSAIDVRTGRAGGVPVCGVTWGLSPDALAADPPDYLIGEPAELLRIVERA